MFSVWSLHVLCVEFACSLCGVRMFSVWSLHVLCVEFLSVPVRPLSLYSGNFLPQTKNMQDKLIGDCKLAVGVNGCLSLYYISALLLTGDLSWVYLSMSRPVSAEIGSSSPATLWSSAPQTLSR